ncbi:MAG: molecular chaperone TorD family protein [Chloroflexi bacterium]|nr:molecular chaperone TorD family protein [Chloroflexota bacterium]
MSGRGIGLDRLARFRQGAYRLLAALLRYPHEGDLAAAADAARALRRRSPWASELAFYGPWDYLLRRVASLGPAQVPALQETYSALFLSSAARSPVPLCESAYVDPAVVAPGRVLAQVEADYAAVGLRLAPGGEPPDHVTIELEVVSVLCRREAEAWEAHDLPQVLTAEQRQQGFLERHPCQWFPALAGQVAVLEGESLYAAVTQAARVLVAHDADFLRALTSQVAAASASAKESVHARPRPDGGLPTRRPGAGHPGAALP